MATIYQLKYRLSANTDLAANTFSSLFDCNENP